MLGGLLLALSDDPSSTRVWAQGAQGERVVGAALDALPDVLSLHDRRVPKSRANIDHLAVSSQGVWVVDAKTHTGALEVRRSGGLLSPIVEQLVIAGRDQSRLLEGLRRQVDVVATSLRDRHPQVPVFGALCFVGTDLPWTAQSAAGFPLVSPRRLAKLVLRPGPLTSAEQVMVAESLALHFRAA